MSDFQQQYKAKPTKFVDTNGGRNIRVVQYENSRKQQRASVINERRSMSNGSSNLTKQDEPQPTKPEARVLRLQSWKAARDMRKKMDLLKKKRPFLTGIIHHRLYSPISHNDNVTGKSMQHQKVRKPAAPLKRNTRATEERSLSKACAQGLAIFTESPNPSGSKKLKNQKKQQSIAPSNYQFKPPAGLHHMQLIDRVDLQSTSALGLSEVVSTSRTRGASRKGYVPTNDTVMKNMNISIEDEELAAQYFQFLLDREINRLNELCEEWAALKDEPTITEDAQYLIHQAIGQTNLLICKKFERFRGLVTDCETGNCKILVTCKDLQRFWDMMYMEIKDCDTRFEKLEKLCMQGWKEEEPAVSKPVDKKKTTTKKKKVVSTKSSSLRSFLEEKKKMSQETKDEDDTGERNSTNRETLNRTHDKIESSPSAKYRTRSTSGSVDLDNKWFTPSNKGRLKSNLLLKVELSHRERTSSTVIKVSKMCKTLDLRLDNSISSVNSDQTQMKTILKPSKTLTKENCFKVLVDEEVRAKLDLALAIIDSFDLDEEVPINSAKQLNFDDSIFEEAEDDQDAKEHSDLRNSVGDSTSRSTSHRSRLRRQDALDESNETTDKISLVNTIPSVPVTKIKDNAAVYLCKRRRRNGSA